MTARRKAARLNPWGLSHRQEDVMRTMVRVGSQKLASRELGIELSTIQIHLCDARRAMRLHDKTLTQPLLCYLAFAAWDGRRVLGERP